MKPGMKKLLLERGREINQERSGALNLLHIRQSYLVLKLQSGEHHKLSELKLVQKQIVTWHIEEAEKVKFQSIADEMKEPENVRIYHHELHRNHIKISQIIKLKVGDKTLVRHNG